MTCIVAVADSKKVWMGADSAATGPGLDRWTMNAPKVWNSGPFVFGVAGNPSVMQTLKTKFIPVLSNQDPYEYIAGSFVDQLQEVLGPLGADSLLLVGYRGRIFEIVMPQQYLVLEPKDNYASIGSGAPFALGSLRSSRGNPQKRITQALEAASTHNAGCAPPFNIINGGNK
jgi:ATP-dependent protease HslVU (ClpYQ) peptidase subunit